MNTQPHADDLVALFRAEAAKRHDRHAASENGDRTKNLPPPRDLPPIQELPGARPGDSGTLDPVPIPTWWRTVDPKTDRLKALTSEAKLRSDGPKNWPKFLRSLFRKQGGLNRAFVDSINILAKTNEQLTKQTAELSAAFQAQSAWLQRLSDQMQRGPVEQVHRDLTSLRAALQPVARDLQVRLNALTERLQSTELRDSDQSAELRETRWNLLNLTEDVSTVTARIGKLSGDVQNLGSRLQKTDAITDANAEEAARVRSEIDRLNRVDDEARTNFRVFSEQTATLTEQIAAKATATSVVQLDERLGSEAVYIKAQLSRLQSRIDRSDSPRETSEGLSSLTEGAADTGLSGAEFDAFYLAFENQFRGERADIQERLGVYLPFLKSAGISDGVLDLGCGRGEWLELLRKEGMQNVSGVDLNAAMVEQCSGRSLPVTHADALKHLKTLPDDNLGAITSFHLIEHLPVRVLLALLREIHRTLRPGGLTILETPNPRNLLVGASDFFRDPTHEHPIHPDTICFELETIGFANVSCYFLNDEDGRRAIPAADFTFADLQSYIDVPRDFAVIARKA